MTVLTFSSAPLFIIVVSTAAYVALIIAVVLYFRVRSLRRQVSALQRDTPSRRQSKQSSAQQIPTSPEDMSAEVARWARSSPAPHESGGPILPPEQGAGNEQAPRRVGVPRGTPTARPDHEADPPLDPRTSRPEPTAHRPSAPIALPSGSTIGAPHAERKSAAGVTDRDLPPVTPAAIDRVPVPALLGQATSVTGGVYIGGNGKGQDRAQVTLNPALQPSGWYAYAVVCDGVGGIGDGAVAAETALESFNMAMAQWLADNPGRLRSGNPSRITESLETGVREAHIATRELSRNPLQRGSSTTLDAALVIPAKDQGTVALVTHIGDGVLWTLDARGLHRLPADPTAVPRPLGADLDLSAELHKVALPPGTRLVLTSDGFEAGLSRGATPGTNGIVTVSSIAAKLVANGSSSAEIAHCIGGLAAASSPDDVTVVVVG